MQKRIRTMQEVIGAEIMLAKVKELAYNCNNLDEFKFEIMLLNSALRNTKENILADKLKQN